MLLVLTMPLVAAQPPGELVELSLEELANIQITSVSKKAESIADAPASIFVITSEDIRRSGAISLPEALRLAPNLQVARINAHSYAISARGFNSLLANKLSVMVDGRALYAPLFSGVFWDVQDVVLEDVDRIEVVSGPGATLWGANAVNGVINVITRPARDTQGTMVAGGASSQLKNGVVRHGGAMDNGGHYRVYGKYTDHDNSRLAGGGEATDGWHIGQAGFRSDWGNATRGFSLHGDAYTGRLRQHGMRGIEVSGANVVGRANRQLEDSSTLTWKAYFDHVERKQPDRVIERLDTADIEFQQAMDIALTHHLVWGAGYRLALSRAGKAGIDIAFLPESRTMHWGNVFVQDEWALAQNLHFTAGLKLEQSTYTDAEHLPSLRLAWKPATGYLLWAAASRSIRAPSRVDRDLYSPDNPDVNIDGGRDVKSEVAKVMELGYRANPHAALSYSVTAFYSDYDKLRTVEQDPASTAVPQRFVFRNGGEKTARGIEMWGAWQAVSSWRLSGGLVLQKFHSRLKAGRTDLSDLFGFGTNDPERHWMLRSSHDLGDDQKLDLTVRHVGRLPQPAVPAYTAVDLRFAWQVRPDLELSVLAQNLLDRAHVEYGSTPGFGQSSELERSVFVKMLWRM